MAKSPLHSAVPPRPLSHLSKTANPQASEVADREALRMAMAAGLSGLGLGAFLRSMKAVGQTMRVPVSPSATGSMFNPTMVELRPTSRRRPLNWVQPAATPKRAKADALSTGADWLYDNVLKPTGIPQAVNNAVPTTNPLSKPWLAPAVLGSALAGGTASWKAVDWLADRHRKMQRDSDLTAAEKEYMDALQSLHGTKMAGVDEVYVQFTKQAQSTGPSAAAPAPAPSLDPIGGAASTWQNARNILGLGSNALTLAFMGSALPAGLLAYKYVRDSSDTKALQEALAARQRDMQTRRPAPLMFSTAPAA